jgi:hypothetical protein
MSDASPQHGQPFTVHAAGPGGSGRYWEVLVSWQGAEGLRGFCLSTASSGWRQIGADQRLVQAITPLVRWTQDVDGDGQPELVLRSTLEFAEDASLDETCITASAYDLDGEGFVLDPGSTRVVRAKLAQAYGEAAARPEAGAQREHYARAAQRLAATSCAH